MNWLLSIVLAGSTLSLAQQAQEDVVQLSAKVDKAQVTTTDTFVYSIAVTVKEELATRSIEVPEVGDKIHGLRVVDFGLDPWESNDDGQSTRRRWYKLQADVSGSYVLPGTTLTYELDGNQHTTATGEIFVEVLAPGSDGAPNDAKDKATDIRDIKPLVPAPPNWPAIALVAGTVILLISGVTFAYYWSRRDRSSREEVPPPYDRAVSRLTALKRDDLLSNGRVKEFHFRLSAAVREYVEGRYGFPATDRTTQEIQRHLPTLSDLNAHQTAVMDILNTTDLVKFTDSDPGNDQSQKTLQLAEDFIERTRPIEERQESVL